MVFTYESSQTTFVDVRALSKSASWTMKNLPKTKYRPQNLHALDLLSRYEKSEW